MSVIHSELSDLSQLTLPPCPIPRPGEEVSWYAGNRPMHGRLLGHDIRGNAIIRNKYDVPTSKPFSEIRVKTPLQRLGPNWETLPTQGRIFKPSAAVSSALKQLLGKRIPPGPQYSELVTEIWSRGFEVFVVGGTVRDVLAGKTPNDVDIVTTMPIFLLRTFLKTMYSYDPIPSTELGFVRIGETSDSGDPFIDLKVFSDSLPGTRDAVFGTDFRKDTIHRDFACNSLYYDPLNDIIIDPTGIGVTDAVNQRLTFICDTSDTFQHAQIFIRAIKYSLRGFVLTPDTLTKIRREMTNTLAGMRTQIRIDYFKAQLLSKTPIPSENELIVKNFESQMKTLGLENCWDVHFKPIYDKLLS